MLIKQILMGVIGLAGGTVVASGLLAFISSLGVVSDFAVRTGTGNRIHLYEKCVALGGVLGNVLYIYQFHMPFGAVLSPLFGLFSGIFVGAWTMALAEVLNIFPIYIRRIRLIKFIPYLICGIALGKSLGSLIYFYLGF
ncbi:MAG: stage V sporulation protein AB [Lachnospiraceae bacterium]